MKTSKPNTPRKSTTKHPSKTSTLLFQEVQTLREVWGFCEDVLFVFLCLRNLTQQRVFLLQMLHLYKKTCRLFLFLIGASRCCHGKRKQHVVYTFLSGKVKNSLHKSWRNMSLGWVKKKSLKGRINFLVNLENNIYTAKTGSKRKKLINSNHWQSFFTFAKKKSVLTQNYCFKKNISSH